MLVCCTPSVSAAHCDAIAAARRRLRRLSKLNLLILDESGGRVSVAPTHTLVAPGESAYVVVEDDSAYARRYDMIACCTYDRVFPPIIYTPEDRAALGVDGVRAFMLEHYINTVLAQAVAALDRYPLTLVLDKSKVHNVDRIKQAFIDGGCQDLVDIVVLPSKAAKRMSPLDNALFHTWKENIRRRGPISSSNLEQVMADSWTQLTARDIQPHYHHCLLMRYQDVYADCPDASAHQHRK